MLKRPFTHNRSAKMVRNTKQEIAATRLWQQRLRDGDLTSKVWVWFLLFGSQSNFETTAILNSTTRHTLVRQRPHTPARTKQTAENLSASAYLNIVWIVAHQCDEQSNLHYIKIYTFNSYEENYASRRGVARVTRSRAHWSQGSPDAFENICSFVVRRF